MRERISAIIIDKEKDKHDYSNVKTIKYNAYCEDGFEIKIVKDSNGIFSLLKEYEGYDCIITIGDTSTWGGLLKMPYEVRKKWVHLESFDAEKITDTIISVFLGNLGRLRGEDEKLFSIFTCTFNTPKEVFLRLYKSLLNQTYENWNWWILDDTPFDDKVKEYVEEINDFRVHLIKNVSYHGNIGYNKHLIASACDGEYIVEVDHDDELTEDCLFELNRAIKQYSDSDFIYSDCCEIMNNAIVVYDKGNDTWGYGEGRNMIMTVKGEKKLVSTTPYITPYSIRTIHMQPNHVRCWRNSFYKKIGGHDYSLSVLDDMDIIIRTFLHGKMTKINKVLYIQHEGNGERGKTGENTQSKRFAEIQRTAIFLQMKYDKDIHNRINELGYKDSPWNEEQGYSEIWNEHEINNIMCNIVEE